MMSNYLDARRIFLLSVALVSTGSSLSGQDRWFDHLEYQLTAGYRLSPQFTFSEFPLSVRSVPLHENDDYLRSHDGAEAPLPDATLTMHEPVGIDWTLSMGRSFWTAGLVYTLRLNPKATIDSDQRYQQTQWGDEVRRSRASLRWYQPVAATFNQAGVTAAAITNWYSVNRIGLRGRLGGTYDITGMAIEVESGWDRFKRDEIWKRQRIGNLREHRLLASIEFTAIHPEDSEYSNVIFRITYLQPFYGFTLHESAAGISALRRRVSIPLSGAVSIRF